MLLDEQSIHSLTLSDIQRLVSEQICESQRLEYKLEYWGTNDDGRREMLRDISAFANAYGGYVVIGIGTERGRGAGDSDCPSNVAGIPPLDYAERISRSCRDNLDPICPGVDVVQIQVEDNRIIIVVKVPQSLAAPHMITFKGLNQFWQRHGTDKQPMSTNEVREIMLSRMHLEDGVIDLANKQLAKVESRAGGSPVLRLWSSPVTPMLTEIDVRDHQLREILGTQGDPYRHNCELAVGTLQPSLQGIQGVLSLGTNNQGMELLRRGYLEFYTSRFVDSRSPSERSVTSIVRFITSIRVSIWVLGFTIFTCRQMFLRVRKKRLHPPTRGPGGENCSPPEAVQAAR